MGMGTSVVSGMTGGTARSKGFEAGDATALLGGIRGSKSTRNLLKHTEGHSEWELLLASLPVRLQHAARLNVTEMAELLERYEAAYDRWEMHLGRPIEDNDDVPQVMTQIDRRVAEVRDRLVLITGPENAKKLLRLAQDPEARAAMGLGAESEDEDNTVEGARLFRRRLATFKSFRLDTSGSEQSTPHDQGTASGGRMLWNNLRTRDPMDELSYYERSRLKYGRGRRGSTTHVGAWSGILG